MFSSLQKFPAALGFLCVCVQGFLAVLGSPAQDPTAVVVSEFLLAWVSVPVAKMGACRRTQPRAGYQTVRVKVLAGLGVLSAAVICFVLRQVDPYPPVPVCTSLHLRWK